MNILENCRSIIHCWLGFFCIYFSDLYDTAPEHFCVCGYATYILMTRTGF